MHDVVELRSDTFTLPSPAMREAMARADVGDDVWEEDPTVQRLEALAARRTGKEAGLFVASGTQGNLVSILAQTEPGQEILLDADCHIFGSEVGGAARLGGLQTRPLATERGFLTPAQVRESVRPANIHLPVTGLVCIENTHNRHGAPAARPRRSPPWHRPPTRPGCRCTWTGPASSTRRSRSSARWTTSPARWTP